MGVTRLKRKDRRNKSKANNRVSRIKQLIAKPVIKNVDVEEIKASFAKADTKTAEKPKKATSEKETPAKAEKEEKATTVKAEKKEKPADSAE